MKIKENEEPLLVGGINYEIREFDKKEIVLEEFVEGVISYRSKNIAKEFIDEIDNYLTQGIFKKYLEEKTPLFYIVFAPESMEIFMYAQEFVREMYEFKEYERRLLQSIIEDLS